MIKKSLAAPALANGNAEMAITIEERRYSRQKGFASSFYSMVTTLAHQPHTLL